MKQFGKGNIIEVLKGGRYDAASKHRQLYPIRVTLLSTSAGAINGQGATSLIETQPQINTLNRATLDLTFDSRS